MPSPFPGMNPYLEQKSLWRGFHTAFLSRLQAAITPRIVPRYFAELEESLYIDPDGEGPKLFAVADTAIADPLEHRNGSSGVAVLAAPVTVTVPEVTKKKARRLVIHDTKSREVITVIELLSPSNKEAGTDRDHYVEKRVAILTTRTNFIEIDLLRGGKRLPIRTLPEGCDYYTLVSRWWERPQMGLWPVRLREPLPVIPLPLRQSDSEPQLALKAVLDNAYDDAGYAYRIYDSLPEPPLTATEVEWAQELVPALRMTP